MMIIENGLLEGQVLQRLNSNFARATITGRTERQGAVLATLSKGRKALPGWINKRVGQAKNGKFSAKLDRLPVGGAYELKLVVGEATVTVSHFYVGDVWIMAGQSNMEGVGNLCDAPEPHPLVRAFCMDRVWRLGKEPIHILGESPDMIHSGVGGDRTTARTVREKGVKGTGMGLYFAKEMVRRSDGVPQGLICTAHGGTSMNQWSSKLKHKGGGSLYGSMLLSVRACGQPVAGVLWYQGESDANPSDAPLYTARMKALVAAVRKDLKQPKLTWMMVQIARVIAPDSPSWNSIQDQQRKLHRKISHLETVSAIDLGLDDGIHISGKDFARLGIRMARLADGMVYQNRKEPPAPDFEGFKVIRGEGGGSQSIEVSFKNVVGGLTSRDRAEGFTLLDQYKRPLRKIFKTTASGNKVVVDFDSSPEPVFLSYAYGTNPYVNITDARDMPLPAFGPVKVFEVVPQTPFLKTWEVSQTVPALLPLDKIVLPERGGLTLEKRSFTTQVLHLEGFVNMHERWVQEQGHAFFFAEIDCAQEIPLLICMGYDGPFRLWVDGAPFFTDMKGVNPCLPDKKEKRAKLTPGRHQLAVGMEVDKGKAWGFFLRFKCPGIPFERVEKGDFILPTFPG